MQAPDDVAQRLLLQQALAGLPPRWRAVLVLRYCDDLSEVRVAEVLGCSLGTVKSSASRGLARLRAVPGLASLIESEHEETTA